MISTIFFILSHTLWILESLQMSISTRGWNSYQIFIYLYWSTSELDCDIINRELMSSQNRCVKIYCESCCIKENCPLYLYKQPHQSYRKLLKLLNKALSSHWFLLSYLLLPWLIYRCGDLKKEQAQKHFLTHTDPLSPLLFNLSRSLKNSLKLGPHHGINNMWTQKTTSHSNSTSVLMAVKRLCSLFKSLAMQVFYQGLFVHVTW